VKGDDEDCDVVFLVECHTSSSGYSALDKLSLGGTSSSLQSWDGEQRKRWSKPVLEEANWMNAKRRM